MISELIRFDEVTAKKMSAGLEGSDFDLKMNGRRASGRTSKKVGTVLTRTKPVALLLRLQIRGGWRHPPGSGSGSSGSGSVSSLPLLVPAAPAPTDTIKAVPSALPNGELLDPSCQADAPVTLQFEDITSAAFKIRTGIVETPCQRSHSLSQMTGFEIYLKKDFLQFTGSFKERGARYALLMLSEEQRAAGVISASLGNHAQALSYHGGQLGIAVTVVMPLTAPIMKIQACRQHGATVLVQGADMREAKGIAMRRAQELGLSYINGYDHPHIMAGQGTLGLEIADQLPDADAIVVPVGGGGLIAGVARAVKSMYPRIKIIGVESERCASFSAALAADKPVQVASEPTIADGLAVPMVGYNAYVTAAQLVDRVVVVKEEWIAIAILRLLELEKCVVEGAGAAGLAAILAGHLDEFKGLKVVLPLCGGNIDTTVLGRCLERGLAADGRLVRFTVTVSDRPGGIADLCKELAKLEVSIKDIVHERAWLADDIFSVSVKVVCETRDMTHAHELRDVLQTRYDQLIFHDIHDTRP